MTKTGVQPQKKYCPCPYKKEYSTYISRKSFSARQEITAKDLHASYTAARTHLISTIYKEYSNP